MKQLINKYIVGLLFVSALGLFLIPSASRVEAATFLAGEATVNTSLDNNIYAPSSSIQISTSADSTLFKGDATATMYDSSNHAISSPVTVLSSGSLYYYSSFKAFIAPNTAGNYFIRVHASYNPQTDPSNNYCYYNYLELQQTVCPGYSVYIDLPFQVLPPNVAVIAIDSSNKTTTSLVGGGKVAISWKPNFDSQSCACTYIGVTADGIKKSKLSCGTSVGSNANVTINPNSLNNISKTTTFDVTCNTAVPVDGVCSTTSVSCISGTLGNSTTPNTNTTSYWDCNGLYGGTSSLACSMPVGPTGPDLKGIKL